MQRRMPGYATLKKATRKAGSFDLAFIIMVIAVVIALLCIVRLSRTQAAMKRSMAEVEGTISGPQSCQPGDVVPSFRTRDLLGEPAEIAFDGTLKYLLFIFSPGCSECQREIPEFNKLSARFQAKGYVVRAISIGSIQESAQYLKDKELDFETLIMPNMAIRRTYRVVSIPETLVVSSKGVVEWVRYGVLTTADTSDLLSISNR
jgi:peroxiredoxin